MRPVPRRLVIGVLLALVAAAVGFFAVVAPVVDSRLNTVRARPPYAVGERARALHATLRVADLHDDLLLWPRDPLARSSRGSTDVPRLIEGNVAITVFSTVSRSPRGQNYLGNADESDNITLLAAAERRPFDNWLWGRHLLARARWTSEKLRTAARESGGQLTFVASVSELDAALEARSGKGKRLIGLLSVEGLQVLEGRLENIDSLFRYGVRMAGLAHFVDNDVAGSAHGIAKGGLTPLGIQVVPRLEAASIVIDLAHVSAAAVADVFRIVRRPLVVSHGGVAAVCPGPRNWTDDQLRLLARNGGVIGIGFWETAVCDPTPGGIAKAIRHAVDIAGIDHVGLGSDWDGAIEAAFDATGLPMLTEALIAAGFTDDEIRKIMGENVIRILREGLPGT